MKLAIGTVQFGMDYGISNKAGKTEQHEVLQILSHALKAGIKVIDTAYSYGDSEEVLGQTGLMDQFNIVTKTAVFPEADEIGQVDRSSLLKSFDTSLKRLRVDKVYGLMIHQVNDLYKKGGDQLMRALINLREQKLVEKIGVSIYSEQDAEFLLQNFEIDIVQLPLSIFDQRFIRKGYLSRLKQAGVEIHIRSAFLQGLVFMQPEQLSERKRFKEFLPVFEFYHDQLKQLNLKPEELSLSYLNHQPEIDSIVCGVNSLSQLKELIDSSVKNVDCSWITKIAVDDEEVINPLKWLDDKI